MKKWLLLLIPLVAVVGRGGDDLSLGQVMAARFGAQMKMRVSIVDDAGNPVPDANVKCLMTTGGRDWNVCEERTGTNGVCFVSGRTNGEEIRLRISKEGYYVSAKSFCFVPMHNFREVSFNRWQPYGEEVRITLYKIRNPAKVVKHCVYKPIPNVDVWYGFDLKKGDWVAPYGNGETEDMYMRLRWDGKPHWETKLMQLDVKFKGEKNGFYVESQNEFSKLRYNYLANSNEVYRQEITYYTRKTADGWESNMKEEGRVSRTRTVLSSAGGIESCNYSRIFSIWLESDGTGCAYLQMYFIFNPTPNDPNLEYAS